MEANSECYLQHRGQGKARRVASGEVLPLQVGDVVLLTPHLEGLVVAEHRARGKRGATAITSPCIFDEGCEEDVPSQPLCDISNLVEGLVGEGNTQHIFEVNPAPYVTTPRVGREGGGVGTPKLGGKGGSASAHKTRLSRSELEAAPPPFKIRYVK